MESLAIATKAVAPFILYIALGLIIRKVGWAKESFLRELNKVIFQVFFPFIMFDNLYDADFGSLSHAGFVLFAVAATLVVIGLACVLVPLAVKADSRRGVIIQAIYRSNSVLFALPLAESVLGESAGTKACILIAFVVPLYNIAAVAILEFFRGGKVSPGVILTNIIKNPLIIGAIAGILFRLLPITMPDFLVEPIVQLSGLATPMSLFVLGGTLHFTSLKKNWLPLSVGTVLKLVVIPAILVVVMALIGFPADEFFAVFCLFATPVAAASFPMAQSMGGDADLAGEYVVVTTLCSIGTIFVWILILRAFGLI